MSKHTPGPWKVIVRRESVGVCGPGIWIHSDGHRTVVDTGAMQTWPIAEPDRRLIAAAPCLLSACEALIAADHPDHFAARMSDSEMAAIEAIKSAIAKATGDKR